MSQRISMVRGVAQVVVYGAQKYAVRIQVDPRQLASRGLGIVEVANALDALNVNLPIGAMQGPDRALTVSANGQLFDSKAYESAVVAWRGGEPVRLADLGALRDSV